MSSIIKLLNNLYFRLLKLRDMAEEEFKFDWFWFWEEENSWWWNFSFEDEEETTWFSWFWDSEEWWNWWWNQWWMEWWNQWIEWWWDMFWWAFWWLWDPNSVYSTRKQAYVDSFKWNPEQIQIQKNSLWFIWSFKKLFEINSDIYKELNIVHYILIWMCAIILWIALYFLKELFTYIISYLTLYLQWLIWVDKFLILIIYFFWIFYILNYLDWVSKLLNTIQLPIKILLLISWVFYLMWYISSDLLFTWFVVWIFPLVLMKLFIFNETDTWILEKIKNWASIEDLEVKQEINNIINKASDSLLWDLPEQQELLIWNIEEEEQKYQLWFEMLNRNKEEKKLSWFLVWERMNLYYLNYIEEEMPVV